MQMVPQKPPVFDSLYIGGGTPSVLGAEAICQIIQFARQAFNIQSDAEMTLEANPATVNLDNLNAYRKFGINRLNIGVQSFQNSNLQFLGRLHSADDAFLSLEWARQAGFDNVGLDLICGLEGQDEKNWLVDLKRAVDIKPQHISCYMLTTESGTPLAQDEKAGRTHLPSEESMRALFNMTIDFLTTHGYEHYEISNFARRSEDQDDANMSRHNLKYWSFAPYIGLGPSAHSFLEPERYWNHRELAEYIKQIDAGNLPIADREELTQEQMIVETIYLGFRTMRGIDLYSFNDRFGIDFSQAFSEIITELEAEDMLKIDERNCALTRKGLLLLDSIASRFIWHRE
jgi:oxygen-independent coproporphyrinogen-3 oxidase